MITIPRQYEVWRASLAHAEISLGVGGLSLAQVEHLKEAQVGYSVDPNGVALPSWKPHWLVIGYDTALGDPIFLDTSDGISVLTAMHGTGAWDPVRIADSLEGFSVALAEMQRLSVGREHPVALEANPIGHAERASALSKIQVANPESDLQFWELQFGSEQET